jgi:hypothetical protein
MSKLLLIVLLFGEIKIAIAQDKITCTGLEKVNSGPILVLNGYVHKAYLSKTDLCKYDIMLGLTDPGFKLIGFKASISCHSSDLVEKDYLGNKIEKSDPFIRYLQTGDIFRIDCINLRKDGKMFSGYSIQVNITE